MSSPSSRPSIHRPGLLLRSPFSDLASVAGDQIPVLPVGLLLRDRYPVLELVAQLDTELTVVLGTADSLVAPQQSRAVADAADAQLVEVDGAGHNDRVLLDGDELVQAVMELVDRSVDG